MSRVLIAEKISESGAARLRDAGHEVVDGIALTRAELLDAVGSADVLLVRSATRVDAELLARAGRLAVVGRAGVGVDNVDMAEATRRGVLVINSPTGNVVSAVEHTFALLFALLRRIPDAVASLRAGRWDRSKFVGAELEGKTIGIVGLGQVGSRVATRAGAFGARVVGFDPFLPAEKAQEIGVALVEWEELLAISDIVTLHATATDSAKGMINAGAIARMKKGACLINVARGSLVDRDALFAALSAGQLGGAALDVFDPEPPDASDPIFQLPNVVATPHLGASTQEAQERVATQTIEAVLEALSGAAYVPAVNLPFRKLSDAAGAARWMDLAERAAKFLAQISEGRSIRLAVDAWSVPGEFLRPMALAAIKGALSSVSPETVNLVNALSSAKDRGLAVSETLHEESGGYSSLVRVTLSGEREEHRVEGTIFGKDDARIVSVDDRPIEFRPRGTALYILNRDVPGVVGLVGTILGAAGVNIADFTLSRGASAAAGGAAAVLTVDSVPPAQSVSQLKASKSIESVRVVTW